MNSRRPTVLAFRAGNEPRGHRRCLLRHIDGNADFALAAYHAGEGNVGRAGSPRRARDRALTVSAIPGAETRADVRTVQGAERASRRSYVSALHK